MAPAADGLVEEGLPWLGGGVVFEPVGQPGAVGGEDGEGCAGVECLGAGVEAGAAPVDAEAQQVCRGGGDGLAPSPAEGSWRYGRCRRRSARPSGGGGRRPLSPVAGVGGRRAGPQYSSPVSMMAPQATQGAGGP